MPCVKLPFIFSIPADLTQNYQGTDYFIWPLVEVNRPIHDQPTPVPEEFCSEEDEGEYEYNEACECFQCKGYPAAPFEFDGHHRYTLNLFGHRVCLYPNGEATVFVDSNTNIEELEGYCRGLATKLALLWKWTYEVRALRTRNYRFLKGVLGEKLFEVDDDPLRMRSAPEGLNDQDTAKAVRLWQQLCAYGEDARNSLRLSRCWEILVNLKTAIQAYEAKLKPTEEVPKRPVLVDSSIIAERREVEILKIQALEKIFATMDFEK